MFKPLRYSASDLKYALIDNSQTLSVGELIIPGVQGDASVVLTAGGTDGAVLGAVMGIKGKDGKVLEVDTIVAEADNVTDKMIQVSYIPAHLPVEYEGDLDAAAETTDNSGAFGNFTVDSTGLLLDESTVQAFSVVENMQLFSYGLTGLNTTQVTCRIISLILGYDIA
jgi:hypothetical protein